MIQIEHLSTAQVTHIHATALYKDHYINTALTIRNTTETSIHTPNTVINHAEKDDEWPAWNRCTFIHQPSTEINHKTEKTAEPERGEVRNALKKTEVKLFK